MSGSQHADGIIEASGVGSVDQREEIYRLTHFEECEQEHRIRVRRHSDDRNYCCRSEHPINGFRIGLALVVFVVLAARFEVVDVPFGTDAGAILPAGKLFELAGLEALNA